jgi:hypothetical protein
MIGAGVCDIAEAFNGVCLAEHGADFAVETQRCLKLRVRRTVIGASECNVADAFDAIGLAQHVARFAKERQRGLEFSLRGFVLRPCQRDIGLAQFHRFTGCCVETLEQ